MCVGRSWRQLSGCLGPLPPAQLGAAPFAAISLRLAALQIIAYKQYVNEEGDVSLIPDPLPSELYVCWRRPPPAWLVA